MKTEDKVVTLTTAKQLVAAGWSEPTEWGWAEVKPDYGALRYMSHLMPYQYSLYPFYPAPDASELLEALRQVDGVLELTIDIDDVGAQLSYVGEFPYQRTGGETPQQALAQLWCAVHAKAEA